LVVMMRLTSIPSSLPDIYLLIYPLTHLTGIYVSISYWFCSCGEC
jgi:hypothetical protein